MDVDLNLMRVFDTLIELRSVTRAADRLGLTQSAVSHALGRLRQMLGDPLFVRSARGLQPTARAEAMAVDVREGLRRLRGAIAPDSFDQAHGRRRFTIAAGTYFCALLIPGLIEQARRDAPGVSFRIVPHGEHLIAWLDRGTVDLALGTFTRIPGRFAAEPLYEEDMVWIAAADSPLAGQPFDANQLAAGRRVKIAPRLHSDPPEAIGDGGSLFVDTTMSGAADDDGVTVYDSQTAITLVSRTDMVALVPRRMASREAGRVALLSGAGGEPPLSIDMLWHSRQSGDAGIDWLRASVRAAI